MIELVVSWCLYYFLHSFLASEAVKTTIYHSLSLSPRRYRLLYNFWNVTGLLIIFYLLKKAPYTYLFSSSLASTITGFCLLLAGSIIMAASFKNYEISSFIGLKEDKATHLQLNGINRFVRHPIYSGTLLAVIGYCLYLPTVKNWVSLLIMMIYLVIGMYLEEKKLVVLYGEEYRRYQKKVKKLIPFIF
jgi:protein-S-isoprenylcysteine O-methyltransferase Ste14